MPTQCMQLMRKMLKKKIHPELGSKINDKENQMMKPGCIHQLLVTNNQQKDEYLSLLQSPQGKFDFFLLSFHQGEYLHQYNTITINTVKFQTIYVESRSSP